MLDFSIKPRGKRRRPSRILLCLLLSLGLIGSLQIRSEGQEFREYLIKAALIYNFAKFVDWPTESFKNDSAPLNVCLLGSDPLGTAWDSIRGKTLKNRKLAFRRVTEVGKGEDCHILFISASEKSNLRSLLGSLKGSNILTISDMEKFAFLGGMIGLINFEDKIQFEINREAVQRTKLKFSSQLLKLAKIVD